MTQCLYYRLTGNCIHQNCQEKHKFVAKQKLKLNKKIKGFTIDPSFKEKSNTKAAPFHPGKEETVEKVGLKVSTSFDPTKEAVKAEQPKTDNLMSKLSLESKSEPTTTNNQLMSSLSANTTPMVVQPVQQIQQQAMMSQAAMYTPDAFYTAPSSQVNMMNQMNQMNMMNQMNQINQMNQMNQMNMMGNNMGNNMGMMNNGFNNFYGNGNFMNAMQQQILMNQQMEMMNQMEMMDMVDGDEDEDSADDRFVEECKDCDCCNGFPYRCRTPGICEEMEQCYCVMQLETEKQIEEQTFFAKGSKDCDCCKGYVYNCKAPICEGLGVCQCIVRREMEDEQFEN